MLAGAGIQVGWIPPADDLRSVRSIDVNYVSQTQIAPQGQVSPERAQCAEVCPNFHEAIELIGKRWTGAILCALTERPMRYGELGKAVPGLSDRLLSQRLRELEDEGLVEREVEAGTPVRVTYSLTATGEDLGPAIRELKAWAKRWKQTA
jgi:DNA-binding HxlR family transcriptional regulator